MNTKVSWKAYHVYYDPPCEPREDIGYFQIEEDARIAKQIFIESRKMGSEKICCQNSKHVILEEIIII